MKVWYEAEGIRYIIRAPPPGSEIFKPGATQPILQIELRSTWSLVKGTNRSEDENDESFSAGGWPPPGL